MRIIQGRNSVDDVDYFDNVVVEYSSDGQTWTPLMEPMQGVYDIVWKGEPFKARYVGIRKLESKKRNWLAIRAFEINPVEESEYGWDGNPYTFYRSDEPVYIDVPAVAKECHLLLGELEKPTCLCLYNKRGKHIGCMDVTSSNFSFKLPKKTAKIKLCNAEIFEALFK